MSNPIIILIGGAAGTAKTSFSKIICNELNMAHRMGSGFIRESAKSFISVKENPYLYNYSFSPHENISAFENLYRQSESINNSMELCIKRAFDEGTSLLIEGVNVIPGLINTNLVTFNVIFYVEDFKKHFKMISGKTHSKRKISDSHFNNVRKIQEEFKSRAKKYNWPTIDLSYIDEVMPQLEVLFKEKGLYENIL